jgi:hypothetical protein
MNTKDKAKKKREPGKKRQWCHGLQYKKKSAESKKGVERKKKGKKGRKVANVKKGQRHVGV